MPTVHESFPMNSRSRVKHWDLDFSAATSPTAFMNDFSLFEDDDGLFRVVGIMKTTTCPTDPNAYPTGLSDKMFTLSSPDLCNWTVGPEILNSDLPDISFATNAWGGSPDGLWAPHIISNPTKDVSGTAYAQKYAMAVTAIRHHDIGGGATRTEQLVTFGFTDDFETWEWAPEACYDPINAVDSAVPVWEYPDAWDTANWRDPKMFYDTNDSKWYMAVSALANQSGTPAGAVARLEWKGTTDFSTDWELPTPGSETGAMWLLNDDSDIPEGPGVFLEYDQTGTLCYWIHVADQGPNPPGGAQYLHKITDLSVLPVGRSYASDTRYHIGQWAKSQQWADETTYDMHDEGRGWGGGWEMIPTGATGEYYVGRFFTAYKDTDDNTAYNKCHYDFATINFTERDGVASKVYVEWPGSNFDAYTCIKSHLGAAGNKPTIGDDNEWWEYTGAADSDYQSTYNEWVTNRNFDDPNAPKLVNGAGVLNPVAWPTQWGTAFENQPTFGDPKAYAGRSLSNRVIYIGNKYTCKVSHTPVEDPVTDGGVSWTNNGAASAQDIIDFPEWTDAAGTYYYTQTAVTSGLDDPVAEPMYIDTWENRPGLWKAKSTSEDTMIKTGYIKSKTFTLQGDRIGFLMGGGISEFEFVALVDAETDKVIFKETNSASTYTMTDRLWDISSLTGTTVYLCVADMLSAYPHGWVSVDSIKEYTRVGGDSDASTATTPIAVDVRVSLPLALGIAETPSESSMTRAKFYDAVASKLHLGVETLAPLSAEMDEWALEALKWLLPLAPAYALESVLKSYTSDLATGIYISRLSDDVLKVVRVTHVDDGDEFIKLSGPQFTAISNQVQSDDFYHALEGSVGQGMYGKGQRVWADVGGEIKAYRVATDDDLRIDYISVPAWSGGNELVVPHGWEGLIATYVCVQVKAKEGDKDQMQFYWQMLKEELSRFQGFEAVGESVGG